MFNNGRLGPDGSEPSAYGSALRHLGPEDYHFEQRLPEHVELLRAIQGFPGWINRIEFSPDGTYFASAFADAVVIFDVATWSVRHAIYEGRELDAETYDAESDLSWAPDGGKIAVSSRDGVRVFEIGSGRLIWQSRSESGVSAVAWSPAGNLIAACQADTHVVVLDADAGALCRDFADQYGPANSDDYGSVYEVAWSPDGRFLASGTTDIGNEDYEIRIWDVEADAMKARLAGHSNYVTDLAWSSHSMTLASSSDDNTVRLWDPVKGKLTHTIEVHTNRVRGVTFSPDGRVLVTNSWDGTLRFWRMDNLSPIGTVNFKQTTKTSDSRIAFAPDGRTLCATREIAGGYIGTSARTGEGIEQLVGALKDIIPWDSKAATVTTATFKRIKDYVLGLKEDRDRNLVLVSADQLRAELVATDSGWSFGIDEMMTATGHLENHGYVAILNNSAGQQFILLLPTILPDLASSIILQADKNPRDLGALSETVLLRGGYQFAELAGLGKAEREVLLDAMVVRFLRHNVCFRETLGAETVLIFPGLIKQKRPLRDEVETVDDVSYLIRGKVENAYPAIAVLLGYTQAFTRVSQWQNQAQYEFAPGQVCGFRMQQEREGEVELVLYYSLATPAYGRGLFQGLFEKFLYERDVEVTRFVPVTCPAGHRQERAIVVQRRRDGKGFVFCGECGQKVVLADTADPPFLGSSVSRQVRREESLALLRSAYEVNLARIKAYRRDRAAPRCHLSHVGDTTSWIRKLRQDLRDAGVYLIEHPHDLADDDLVLLVGTPRAVRLPAILLLAEGDGLASQLTESFGGTILDFRDESRYALALFDLVLMLHSIPLDHDAFSPLREAMGVQWRQAVRDQDRPGAAPPASRPDREVFISYAWNEESKRVAAELDRAFQDEGILKNMNALTPEAHQESGYSQVVQAVLRRLAR